MCLTIDKYFYAGEGNGRPVPFTAEEDITVFKVLSFRKEGGVYTPYQGMPVTFDDNGVFDYSAEFEWDDEENGISCGCHAFYNAFQALMLVLTCINLYTYKAVIPKGSKFFVGENGSVVSNRLIIHNKRLYVSEPPVDEFTLTDYLYKYTNKIVY